MKQAVAACLLSLPPAYLRLNVNQHALFVICLGAISLSCLVAVTRIESPPTNGYQQCAAIACCQAVRRSQFIRALTAMPIASTTTCPFASGKGMKKRPRNKSLAVLKTRLNAVFICTELIKQFLQART